MVGQYASLAVIGPYPAIAYYDATNMDLKFVRASERDGAAWDPPVTVAGAGQVGRYASLADISGRPAIAFYDATNTGLRYVRASNDEGTAWETPVNVASAGDVGEFASLCAINDHPAIAYDDRTNGALEMRGQLPHFTLVGREAGLIEKNEMR